MHPCQLLSLVFHAVRIPAKKRKDVFPATFNSKRGIRANRHGFGKTIKIPDQKGTLRYPIVLGNIQLIGVKGFERSKLTARKRGPTKTMSQQYQLEDSASEDEKQPMKRKRFRVKGEDENAEQKRALNTLRLMKTAIKASKASTSMPMDLKLPPQPAQVVRPALLNQKFVPKNEDLSEQNSKFIAKNSTDDDLPAPQTIPKVIDSDDDLSALSKKPLMKESTVVMLTHARA